MHLLRNFSFLFITFSLFYAHPSFAQAHESKAYKLYVNLENAPFDSLYLQDYTEGRNVVIAGKKTKDFTWEITIPDSIVWNSENMVLLASPYNPKNDSRKMVRLVSSKDGRKVIVVNVGVEGHYNYIYGKYRESIPFVDEKLECLDFDLIVEDQLSDIAIRSQDPLFSWFQNSGNVTRTYESHLASYIELSKRHPDSRFLMSSLSRMLDRYKSADDVKSIYQNFSDRHKEGYWAKRVDRFLNTKKFINTSLPDESKQYKDVVQDSSKYNLVIFSASWCAPCIEEIPLLKKIHKDLDKELILTFISIDDTRGVESFKKLLQKNNIPWRTLFAYQEIKEIKEKYFIEGIPHNILIHPNQNMEKIDVRKEEDRLKLYAILDPIGNKK